jgi:hypothetical protein
VKFFFRELFPHEHNDTGISHDPCIGPALFQQASHIFQEWLNLAVVRDDIGSEIDLFAKAVGIVHRFDLRVLVKSIFPGPQRKPRDAQIDRISAKGIGKCHFFEITSRKQ